MNKNKGFILVLVIFMITFCLGGVLLNNRIIHGMLADIQSKTYGIVHRDKLSNIRDTVDIEMYGLDKALCQGKYDSPVDHFAKNASLERLWQSTSHISTSIKSYGGYTLYSIKHDGKTTICDTSSPETYISYMNNCLKKNAKNKIFLVFTKKVSAEDITDIATYIILKTTIVITFLPTNKDVTQPDEEYIDSVEVEVYG